MTRVTSADEGGAKLNRWSDTATFFMNGILRIRFLRPI